ncbi:MAG: hypothetical protein M3Q16_08350 [Pseudomonadota bacterium]|nr:hypothetical protein [Pseudomonadota bacterium]
MPGFTAEASLYQTSVHYAGSDDGGYLSNRPAVSPQACGFAKNILCNGAIIGVLLASHLYQQVLLPS